MPNSDKKWTVPNMWDDGECWIIGGGISMPRQFGIPEDLIRKVSEGELTMAEYSPYLSALHDKHVIGTNVAFMLGKWVSMMYFADLGIYRCYKKELLYDFRNLKVTDTGNLPAHEAHLHRNIKKLKRDMRFGLSIKPDTIRWNRNSGAGAINLAFLLGVRKIYLLGFDMQPDPNGRTHWHREPRLPNYLKPTQEHTFKTFLKCMPEIAKDANRYELEIINVSPESAIKEFPKVNLHQIL